MLLLQHLKNKIRKPKTIISNDRAASVASQQMGRIGRNDCNKTTVARKQSAFVFSQNRLRSQKRNLGQSNKRGFYPTAAKPKREMEHFVRCARDSEELFY